MQPLSRLYNLSPFADLEAGVAKERLVHVLAVQPVAPAPGL